MKSDYCSAPLLGWKHLIHRTRFESVIGIVDPRYSEVIIDVGCSKGHFVHEFRKRGALSFGVDIDANHFSNNDQGLPFINGSIFSLPLRENSIDKVFISEVLISLPQNPVAALMEAYRVLKPGGKLILCNSKGYEIFDKFFFDGGLIYVLLRRMLTMILKDKSEDISGQREKILRYLGVDTRYGRNFNEKETIRMLSEAGFSDVSYNYHFKRRVSNILGLLLILRISIGLNRHPSALGWDYWFLFPVFKTLEKHDNEPGSGVVYTAMKKRNIQTSPNASGPRTQSTRLPKLIDIYLTDRCNLLCKMCNIGSKNRYGMDLSVGRSSAESSRDSIDKSMLGRIISQAARIKDINIFISGGEPTLELEKLYFILEECTKNNITVGMNSNGMRITKEVAGQLVRSGLAGITISIDGTKDVHDEIRGVPGSYEKACRALEYLIDAKKMPGSKLQNIMVLHAISENNYHNMHEAIKALSQYDLSGTTFSHFAFTSRNQEDIHNRWYGHTPFRVDNTVGGFYSTDHSFSEKIDFDLFVEQIAAVRQYARKKGINGFKFNPDLVTKRDLVDYYINDLLPMNNHFYEECTWFSERVDIDSDGDIMLGYPCFKIVLGNAETDDIVKLWNSSEALKIREFLHCNPNMPACLRCCGNRRRVV